MILWSYQKKHKSSLPLKMINQVQQGKNKPKINLSNKTKGILYLLILSGTSTEVVDILFSEDRDLISLASSLQDAKQKVMRIHIQWRINYHKKRTLIMNLGWGKKTKQVCMLPLGSSSSWQEKQQAKFYHCRNNKLDLIIIL